MLYNDYEEYMREVLGYKSMYNQNSGNMYGNYYNNMDINQYKENGTNYNLEQFYPKVYEIINPVVCKMCDENAKPITEELISDMVGKVYNTVITRIEADNIININVTTSNENSKFVNNKTTNENRNSNSLAISQIQSQRQNEQRRNPLIEDLIRILILKYLTNSNQRPNSPRPPRPPRPGMPRTNTGLFSNMEDIMY